MTNLTIADGLVVSVAAGVVVGFVVAALVVPWTITLSRRFGVIDEPGERSSHTVPTPRLGGIGVALGALAGLGAVAALRPATLDPTSVAGMRVGLLVAGTALTFGLIGLADDVLRGIPVAVRLVAQVLAALVLVAPWTLAQVTDPAPATRWALALAGAVWLIGFVNAFNFMDGIDGMSGFTTVVVGVDLAIIGILEDQVALVALGLVVAGAAIGFLRSNLRPATVFLGDGGSYFLGAWIAVSILLGIGLGVPPEALVAVTIPYLADTSTTLVRRIARRADWRASHHEHTYQKLVELGWSHRSVAGLVAGASAVCAALGLVSLVAAPGGRVVAGAAIVAVSIAYLATPRLATTRTPAGPTADEPEATRRGTTRSPASR